MDVQLPSIISELIIAQNNQNSTAYTNCFTETAIVKDEGNTYRGKTEIWNWIEAANNTVQPMMKALTYKGSDKECVLSAEVSGNFPGSPVVLEYYHTIENDLINTLRIE